MVRDHDSINLRRQWLTFPDARDPFKCSAALSTGTWLDFPSTSRASSAFSKWQPQGCMPRAYAGKKAAACLARSTDTENVFIGDSTVRETFWAVARQLNKKTASEESMTAEKHADLSFSSGGANVRFYWDPFLNSTTAAEYMNRARMAASGSSDKSKGLVVVGSGLWFAKEHPKSIEAFQSAIDAVTDHLPEPDVYSIGRGRPYVMPVQPPFYEKLDAEHKTMTPQKINAMNNYLDDVALSHDIHLLKAFLGMVDGVPSIAYEPKGLHVLPQIADKQAELLLNVHCNNDERTYTYDGTCCFEYKADFVQMAMMAVTFVLAVVIAYLELSVWTNAASESVSKLLVKVWPFLTLMAAMGYCYLADRTHLFDKYQKLYNNQDFFILVAGILAAGLTTIKLSVTPARGNQEKPANQDQPFLSRDQTDEWKGWMQVAILAYHYTGASKVLWIYKIIRLLVASYLFMTGYGHTAYFYQKNDFSLKRVAGVLIRLNLLSVALPWMMGTDYLFYYFAPLVTYWYAIVYLTMRIKNDWNQQLPLFLLKIGISCAVTTLFHSQPWIIDPIFKLTNTVFGGKWDAKEWMFRCSLDQFIVYVGMVVSVLYIRSSKPPPPPPPPQSSMATTSFTRPGLPPQISSTMFYVFDVVALGVYLYASSTQSNKAQSNALHTYISPLAVLVFVHLRNCTQTLRNHYSGAYAWVGKISLETFVLQYHLWLAGDTKGLLSLGLFGNGGMIEVASFLGRRMTLGRWMDCLLLGVVFIWVSERTSTATGAITGIAMKKLFP